MKEKNLAVKLLERLLKERIHSFERTNVVQSKKFSDLLNMALSNYLKGMLTNEEVIEELLKMAEEIKKNEEESNKLGLTVEEKAFYDALSSPEGIREAYTDEQFVALTRELTEQLRRNRTIDWNRKESARAKMRVLVKRLLKKYKYPPEGQEKALETVMAQCNKWADDDENVIAEPETHIVKMYPQFEEDSDMMMAAEPFECYKWNRFDQSIIGFFGGDKTILVGCAKNKKQKEWILSHNIYNVRLGKTKGSMEEYREMFERTSLLVLYDFGKPDKLSAYTITGHKEMGKEELKAIDYPNKNPRKSYMIFSIEPLNMDLRHLVNHHLIEKLIEINPENNKGTPVFIEP